MATITNRATLTYNGVSVNSNVATGEILDEITATKTALRGTYGEGERITYIINIVNTGAAAATGITVTDDLGGYAFGEETLYPLTYTDGSAALFIDGVPSGAPALTPGPPLVFSGITVPAGGNAAIVYETEVNGFAPLGVGAVIENTATADGAGISPVTATESIAYSTEPELTIAKSISPQTARAGGTLTYTFVISNSGTEATEDDGVMITDGFDPVLSSLTATLDGVPMTVTTDYTYDESSGLFETVQGAITVPAATYSQNADGSWTTVPGETTLVISGTIA